MLLERIRIQGFLSHYGTIGDDGTVGPTVLDFTDADLWLVHGPNGAGKSAAVFDAIGFALYKQHRGGVRGAGSLVHQDADHALVSVDIDLSGQRYRIERTIKKNGTVQNSLAEAHQGGWMGIDLDEKLEQWVERQLGMPFSTFQACILLRQGEADSFLKAKGQERRRALLDLVRLSDYERLASLAQGKHKVAAATQARLAGEIAQRADVSPAALAELHKAHAGSHTVLVEATARRAKAASDLALATTAANLLGTIREQKEAIASHQDMLGRADSIETNAQRHAALAAALPVLGALHRARDRQTKAEKDFEALVAQQATLNETTPALGAAAHGAQATHTNAEKTAQEATSAVTALEKRLAGIQATAKAVGAQIKNHTAVGSADACPLCAANLDNENAQGRVAAHYATLSSTLAGHDADAEQMTAALTSAQEHRTRTIEAQTRSQAALAGATNAAAENRKALDSLAKQHPDAQTAVGEAVRESADLLNELPAVWADHAAVESSAALVDLRTEHEGLNDALQAKDALDRARQDAAPAQELLVDATAQLNLIPQALRVTSLAALTEAAAASATAVETATAAEAVAQKAVGAMESEIKRLDALTDQHDAEAKTAGRYKRLADAFGPKKLQARVLRDAQIRVMQNANKTLSSLTNGGWAIHLDDADDELTVLARDPLGIDRAFEYLSGGERFRVSLALAVGVGQTVSGGRSVRSLLVDEGFGALDDDGRGLMVEELHRLRETVLGGGRVVVVAHQDDVKDQFDYRFKISKPTSGPGRGRAVVERSTPGEDA